MYGVPRYAPLFVLIWRQLGLGSVRHFDLQFDVRNGSFQHEILLNGMASYVQQLISSLPEYAIFFDS